MINLPHIDDICANTNALSAQEKRWNCSSHVKKKQQWQLPS